jgi:proteasome accessory factor B
MPMPGEIPRDRHGNHHQDDLADTSGSALDQTAAPCMMPPMKRRTSRNMTLLMKYKGSRAAITRRPLVRIYEIHSAILQGDYPNCSQLAEQLSVERKTIQRDISFMRDELKLPLVYDESLHGYYYNSDVADFPIFQTTAEELAGLFLARQALESVRGTALAETLGSIFSKLTRGMLGQIQLAWGDLDEAFSRKAIEQNPRDIKRFGQIAEAILNQRIISFSYKKLGVENAEARKVHPLHLGEVDGGWYLIAHDTHRNALRTFALPRISRLQISNSRFERPKDFNGRAYLSQSFGIWHVAGDHKRHVVRVELRNYAARLAQERRWHPTQELVRLNAKASRVELRFEVGRLEEVMRWVLGFGSQAKVLGPPELAKMVRAEVRAMSRG